MPFEPAVMYSEPAGSVIEFAEVSHTYSPNRIALQDVSLRVSSGECVGLIGPSGAGKSTLLRLVNGLVTPTSGSVRVLGREVSSQSESQRTEIRRQVGMIFQEFALVERLSVLTNVLVGRLGYHRDVRTLFHLFPSSEVRLAEEALAAVGLEGYREQPVRSLSGGQKQRVGIARALVQQARIVLGDEPTANLDVRTAEEVLSLLVRLASERGVTLLLSLHDVRAARRYCTRIVALSEGRVVWDGVPAEFGEGVQERVFYGVVS